MIGERKEPSALLPDFVEKEVQARIIQPARMLEVKIHTVDDRFAE